MHLIYFDETKNLKSTEAALAGRHGNSFCLEVDEDGEAGSIKEGSLRSDLRRSLWQFCISMHKHQANMKDD